MLSTLIVFSLIALGLSYFVIIRPLFLTGSALWLSDEEQCADESEKAVVLLNTIRELEQEYRRGVLSKEDFDVLSLEYQRKFLKLQKK